VDSRIGSSCLPHFDNYELRIRGLPEHTYQVTGEEYGSLGSGGSYEILTCSRCGRRAYSALPD
jgi:hypothetical protein